MVPCVHKSGNIVEEVSQISILQMREGDNVCHGNGVEVSILEGQPSRQLLCTLTLLVTASSITLSIQKERVIDLVWSREGYRTSLTGIERVIEHQAKVLP